MLKTFNTTIFSLSKNSIYILLLLSIAACQQTPRESTATNQEPTKKDTIYIISKDTIYQNLQSNVITASKIQKETITPIKTSEKTIQTPPAPKPLVIKESTTNTITYYKNSKVISTITTPWVNDTRYIRLYDMKGEMTYEFKDERKSYSIVTELRFRENGSVLDANTHMNPGASMYWYETYTRFDENNVPFTQESHQYPEKLSTIMDENNTKYWDKPNKRWITQQAMPCNAPMNNVVK